MRFRRSARKVQITRLATPKVTIYFEDESSALPADTPADAGQIIEKERMASVITAVKVLSLGYQLTEKQRHVSVVCGKI